MWGRGLRREEEEDTQAGEAKQRGGTEVTGRGREGPHEAVLFRHMA